MGDRDRSQLLGAPSRASGRDPGGELSLRSIRRCGLVPSRVRLSIPDASHNYGSLHDHKFKSPLAGALNLVDVTGIEPATSSMPWRRSPS